MRLFGLIGKKLSHSFSAKFFTEKFAREGLSDCRYELFELATIELLPHFLASHPELEGFNVTIPYKQAIIPYLDGLTYEASQIGAVNCVRRENGRWIGCNTDLLGLRKSLAEFLNPLPEEALVLGTGGASLAVQYLLAEVGVPYALLSRDPLRGNYTYDNLPVELFQRAKLIVNATPLGTYPAVEEAPTLPYAFLTPEHCLFDLVYNPPITTFLEYGRQRGARTKNGHEMLVAQAEASWEFWNEAKG